MAALVPFIPSDGDAIGKVQFDFNANGAHRHDSAVKSCLTTHAPGFILYFARSPQSAFSPRVARENGRARFLDSLTVPGISAALTSISQEIAMPHRLAANRGHAYKGSSIQGSGFLLSPEDAHSIIASDAKYHRVLFPYLGGEDITRSPDAGPSRWVINFFDWSLEEASEYPLCLDIVRREVKPAREKVAARNSIGARRARMWWRYDAQARELYEAIQGQKFVWAAAQTAKYVSIVQESADIVFSHMTVVFPTSSFSIFSVLASTLHSYWIEEYCASLETRLRYIPTDGFETFPFPLPLTLLMGPLGTNDSKLAPFGRSFHEQRAGAMQTRAEGLTKIMNRLHHPEEAASDIQRLRDLHVEMDGAVAAAYGWDDLELRHGFHETKQGVRFTISEAARREVLQRLLRLNHERYAEEVAQGLHERKKPKAAKGRKRAKANTDEGTSLFQNAEHKS